MRYFAMFFVLLSFYVNSASAAPKAVPRAGIMALGDAGSSVAEIPLPELVNPPQIVAQKIGSYCLVRAIDGNKVAEYAVPCINFEKKKNGVITLHFAQGKLSFREGPTAEQILKIVAAAPDLVATKEGLKALSDFLMSPSGYMAQPVVTNAIDARIRALVPTALPPVAGPTNVSGARVIPVPEVAPAPVPAPAAPPAAAPALAPVPPPAAASVPAPAAPPAAAPAPQGAPAPVSQEAGDLGLQFMLGRLPSQGIEVNYRLKVGDSLIFRPGVGIGYMFAKALPSDRVAFQGSLALGGESDTMEAYGFLRGLFGPTTVGEVGGMFGWKFGKHLTFGGSVSYVFAGGSAYNLPGTWVGFGVYGLYRF